MVVQCVSMFLELLWKSKRLPLEAKNTYKSESTFFFIFFISYLSSSRDGWWPLIFALNL